MFLYKPNIMKKEIIIIVLLISLIFLGIISFFVYLLVSPFFVYHTISGQVIDCETNDPIVRAEIGLYQQTLLTWDKVHLFQNKSDDYGKFSIKYNFDSVAQIRVKKDGYIKANQYEPPKDGIIIRMLKGDKPLEVTYNCQLSSECNKQISEIRNGKKVTISWNNCTSPR